MLAVRVLHWIGTALRLWWAAALRNATVARALDLVLAERHTHVQSGYFEMPGCVLPPCMTDSIGLVSQGQFVKEYDMECGPFKAGGPHNWTAEYNMPQNSPQRIAEYVRTGSYHVPVPC